VKTLYVLQHHECEPLGIWAEELNRWHVRSQSIPVWKNAELPAPESTLAAIILGGPMNVNETDRYPFIQAELNYLKRLLEAGIPVIGVCLGAQLLAAALGARVAPGPRPEIGYSAVTLTPAGAESTLFRGFPMELPVFQWHGQGFELPPKADLLASSPDYPQQAFRYGNAWGFQFHLEVTPAMVESWCREYSQELTQAGVNPLKVNEQAALRGQMISLYGRQVIRRFWDSVTEIDLA
jgi:GMP synthase-like glutamine amidotransferase